MQVESRRLYTLDGMRGVAALLVAIYHYLQRYNGWNFPGYLAVDFFFMLSGYVIALNYQAKLASGMTWRHFARVRIVRLLPLYLAGLTLGICLTIVAFPPPGAQYLDVKTSFCAVALNAMMLPSPCSALLFPFNGPSWSLFFEMTINILFAVMLWRCSSTFLFAICVVAAVAIAFLERDPEFMNMGWNWPTLAGGMARTAFSFLLGVIIFRHLGQRRLPAVASLLATLGLTLCLLFNPAGEARSVVEFVTVVAVFPVLLMVGARSQPPRPVAKLCAFAGEISYPLYALHFPLVMPVMALAASLALPTAAAISLFVVLAVLVGWLGGRADAGVRAWLSLRLGISSRRT